MRTFDTPILIRYSTLVLGDYVCIITIREGGNSGWLSNNLSQSEENPEFHEVTALWTFRHQWDPEASIRKLWNILAY